MICREKRSKLRRSIIFLNFSTQSTSQTCNYGGRLNCRSELVNSKAFNVASSTQNESSSARKPTTAIACTARLPLRAMN
ncbi:hypothetical protein J1N35_005160 [Gossypium stocksii]|uniref:Uncharacterized protein n=1 Tax=Gossypium stocksii TaxID=47602 RepID=A0A9D4AJ04_9ROSI|nr:hypothetical protein J1N35_005160 [Gossypium stocksii]